MRYARRPSRYLVVASFALLTIIAWRVEAMGAQLTLTWIAGSSNQTGFSIERSTGTTGTFAEIITTGPSAASYTDSSLAEATTYCYRLRAFNAAGYSGYSPVACGTTPQSFGLAVVKMGAGSGTITSAPAGITCGASCSATYPGGSTVTLTATPAGGSTFTGWSGGGCSGTGACIVTLMATTTVTAGFDLQPNNTLTVSKAGSGSGTVTSSPTGISCGTTCSWGYPTGTALTLTASPTAGSTFTGWSGGGCSGTGACTLTLTASTTVTATFNVASTTTSVDFDNPVPPGKSGSTLGLFAGINWGGRWCWWSAQPGMDMTNHANFCKRGVSSRSFSFSPAPKTLLTVTLVSSVQGTRNDHR